MDWLIADGVSFLLYILAASENVVFGATLHWPMKKNSRTHMRTHAHRYILCTVQYLSNSSGTSEGGIVVENTSREWRLDWPAVCPARPHPCRANDGRSRRLAGDDSEGSEEGGEGPGEGGLLAGRGEGGVAVHLELDWVEVNGAVLSHLHMQSKARFTIIMSHCPLNMSVPVVGGRGLPGVQLCRTKR